MTTATEDLIKQLKRSSRSNAILVPRIEKFMRKPIEIEDDEDRQYLNDLILARSQPRKKNVYSPSMLANCIRQVYFHKTGKPKKPVERIESSGYFLDGNFRHFKWQFCMWKMHRAGIIQLVDVGSICLGAEIYVSNEKGDYGGTIDNIIYIPDIDFLITTDYKGMGGNPFARSVALGPTENYVVQSVGYAGLANEDLIDLLPKRIDAALILGENKNGMVRNRSVNSPLGLYEWQLKLSDYNFLVSKRLKKLRAHERSGQTPQPECTSTSRIMFKDCPFAGHCRGEIERIQQRNKKYRRKKGNPKVELGRSNESRAKRKNKRT
jgi:hypothetical protein